MLYLYPAASNPTSGRPPQPNGSGHEVKLTVGMYYSKRFQLPFLTKQIIFKDFELLIFYPDQIETYFIKYSA